MKRRLCLSSLPLDKGKTLLLVSAAPVADLPVTILCDQGAFEAALACLAARDAAFVATLLEGRPPPRLRRRAPGFSGLAWTVVGQQVSTASAAAIYGRVEALLGCVDAAAIADASDEALKGCGLSAGKLRTLRAVAAACADGMLDFEALAVADAEVAHAALVAIHGIGPWTADVFLLFCLGHADAWPAGDLALQEAARLALVLPARPGTRELMAIGERWRPHRGVAAHCLWAYYGARQAAARQAKVATVQAKAATRPEPASKASPHRPRNGERRKP